MNDKAYTNNRKFKVVRDIEEAKDLWEHFSPHKEIDDEWDFRYTFFKRLHYDLHFIVEYEQEKPIGLLPLQMNNLNGLMPPYYRKDGNAFLEFFGGDDTDSNAVFQKSQTTHFMDYIKSLDIPTYLAPLASSYNTLSNIIFYDNKYYLDLQNYKSYEDFLADKWGKSSRKKANQQVRKLYRDHRIEILENNYEDIALLSEFNKKRFGEDSSFSYDYRKDVFIDLLKLYDVQTLTVVVDGKKEAVSYGIFYKDQYIGMNAGVNNEIEDLAKMLIFLQIDKAIEHGCKRYDAGKGDSGWKEQFHLEKMPQFALTIPSCSITQTNFA